MVTISAIMLIALLFLASKSQLFQETQKVRLSFNYISGLSKNSPVHFAGHKVGKVTAIRFTGAKDGMISVEATFSKDVPVKKDSGAFIDALGFMGEKFVELTPGSDAAPLLPAGTVLRGTDPIPMIELIKKASQIAEEFEKTADSMKGLTDDLEDIVGKNRSELDGIFKNLNEASANLKDMTHDLKLHPWKLLKKTDDKKKHLLFF